MDELLNNYVEMVMQQQEVTNGIKFFSWINFFKR
jgi:hypothetical protein